MQFTDPTQLDYVNPDSIVSVPATTKGSCEEIIITTADGRVFNLGKPSSLFFKLRLALYKWQRRHDLKEISDG